MNKQEIEHQINRYETVRECAEEHLNELDIQLRDLCEAEKPKLRHGDIVFSLSDDTYKGGNYLAIEQISVSDAIDIWGCRNGLGYKNGIVDKATTIYERSGFNIFDLMEDWGKDWEASWHSRDSQSGKGTSIVIDIDKTRTAIWFGSHGGSAWYSPEIIYEVWRNLGHALMTLKKKQ